MFKNMLGKLVDCAADIIDKLSHSATVLLCDHEWVTKDMKGLTPEEDGPYTFCIQCGEPKE